MILLWLACDRGDPELIAQRDALRQWEQGAEALRAGDGHRAYEHFERARVSRPDDLLLAAWSAEAIATWDPGAAADALAEVVSLAPGFALARYNRSAYLARAGRLDEAGPELERALRLGARRPREAMADPDFEPHLAHPAFGFLPDEMLLVAVDAPREPVFLGEQASVRLRVIGAGGIDVAIVAEPVRGPVELVGVVEDVVEGSEGLERSLTWTFVARGAGDVRVGPIGVRAGRWSRSVAEIGFEAMAPPGRDAPSLRPVLLEVPSERLGDLRPPGVRRGADLEVARRPEQAVELTPPAGPPIRYELRDRSRPVWVLDRYPGVAGAAVRVMADGELVLGDP